MHGGTWLCTNRTEPESAMTMSTSCHQKITRKLLIERPNCYTRTNKNWTNLHLGSWPYIIYPACPGPVFSHLFQKKIAES